MKRDVKTCIPVLLITCLILTGCVYSGTDGRIKGYTYPLRQSIVAKALWSSIDSERHIFADSLLPYDSVTKNIEIYIVGNHDSVFSYRLGFVEGAQWDTTKKSELVIVRAYKGYEGGSEGRGDFDGKAKLKIELVKFFEKKVISRIDSVLHVRRTED